MNLVTCSLASSSVRARRALRCGRYAVWQHVRVEVLDNWCNGAEDHQQCKQRGPAHPLRRRGAGHDDTDEDAAGDYDSSLPKHDVVLLACCHVDLAQQPCRHLTLWTRTLLHELPVTITAWAATSCAVLCGAAVPAVVRSSRGASSFSCCGFGHMPGLGEGRQNLTSGSVNSSKPVGRVPRHQRTWKSSATHFLYMSHRLHSAGGTNSDRARITPESVSTCVHKSKAVGGDYMRSHCAVASTHTNMEQHAACNNARFFNGCQHHDSCSELATCNNILAPNTESSKK